MSKVKQMYAAVSSGNVEQAKALLLQHPELRKDGGNLPSWLHHAASNGNAEMAAMLLDQNLPINIKGDKHSALSLAIPDGHVETVRLLLARGADVSVGRPLIFAINARANNLDIFRMLIEHGADLNAKYDLGDTQSSFSAIDWAVMSEDREILDYLRSIDAIQ